MIRPSSWSLSPCLQRDHQRRRHAQPIEPFEGASPGVDKVGPAQRHERVPLERVELRVDVEVGHVAGESLREGFIFSDPDSVGVHHQVPDGRGLCAVEDGERIWMEGGRVRPPDTCRDFRGACRESSGGTGAGMNEDAEGHALAGAP